MDWTHARLIDLYKNIMDRVGFADPKDNFQVLRSLVIFLNYALTLVFSVKAPMNMSGYTAASIPLFTSATVVDKKVDSLPDSSVLFRSVIMPEIRKQELAPLIGVFTRNRTGMSSFQLDVHLELTSTHTYRRGRVQAQHMRPRPVEPQKGSHPSAHGKSACGGNMHQRHSDRQAGRGVQLDQRGDCNPSARVRAASQASVHRLF